MRKWNENDWILAVTIAMFLAFLLFMLSLSGCASKQSQYQIRYTKGCAIDVSVMTSDEAAKIMKDLKYKDCELNAEIGDEAKE